jgi:hypothetical protein
MGVTHVANGDGSVTQFGDDGRELVTFPDPDGSFTRDHVEPAAAAAAQARPQGSNAERIFARAKEINPADMTTVRPESGTVSPGTESDYQRALKPPTMPGEERAPAAQEPAQRLPLAGTDTQGLTSQDRSERESRAEDVEASTNAANQAATRAEQDAAAAREARVQNESDRALGRYSTDLELHELAKKHTLAAEDYAKQQRAAPIDPGQAVGGAKFLYAIMAGVGASLSNFGAALLGQQGNADTNLVDDIIADGVKQQLADRALKVEGAQDSLEHARSEELRLSIRANVAMEKWFESRSAVEKNPEVRAALSANAEERRAAAELQTFKLAEGNYQTEVQHRAVPKPVAAGKVDPASKWNAETKEDMGVLAANGVDAKAYTHYGEERQKLGADATLKHVADLRQVVKDLREKGSSDIPGIGPIDANTQALLRSNDASKVNQALGQVVTTFVKNRSGAAVTDKEREYLSKIIVGTGSNQMESLENGLQHVEAEVRTQLGVLDGTNSGAARAYDQIAKNRAKRTQLSATDKAGLDGQREGADKPAAVAAAAPAAEGSDPIKAVKRKGLSRALVDFLGDDNGEATGSAM